MYGATARNQGTKVWGKTRFMGGAIEDAGIVPQRSSRAQRAGDR